MKKCKRLSQIEFGEEVATDSEDMKRVQSVQKCSEIQKSLNSFGKSGNSDMKIKVSEQIWCHFIRKIGIITEIDLRKNF